MAAPKKYETILIEKDKGITWVIFNRPDKRNAMSPQLHLDMDDALEDLAVDPETEVLVITGAGKAFSAGQDIKLYFRGTAENPARITLRVNKASGAVTGSFVLAEDGVKATRKASFLGYIIPDGSGGTKAEGYFLLPQIPEEGQKATSTSILSGSMKLVQPDPEP